MILNNLKKRIFTSFILLFLVLLIYNFDYFLVYCLIILGTLSIIEFLNMSTKIFTKKKNLYLINFIFISYIFIFCNTYFILSNFVGLKILLYIFLSGCVASDIGGFIFGKIFKGPKLTKISPNKTYSGSIGSLILTSIIISSFFFKFVGIFNYKIIIMSLVVSIFCQLGDLLFSILKRKAKLKDTGNFLPGHGGILDRLDGVFFGIPAGYLFLILLN